MSNENKEPYVKTGDRGTHGARVYLFVILHQGMLMPHMATTRELAESHWKRVSPIFEATVDTKGKDW